jgi:hypothetical protein
LQLPTEPWGRQLFSEPTKSNRNEEERKKKKVELLGFFDMAGNQREICY